MYNIGVDMANGSGWSGISFPEAFSEEEKEMAKEVFFLCGGDFDYAHKLLKAWTNGYIVIEEEDNYACDQCHKLIEDNWNDCKDCPDAVSCFDCGKAGDVCVSCLEVFESEEWPF